MPYITTERVSEIRKELKKEFPSKKGWTLSITKRNYSTVCVDILSAPFQLLVGERKYEQVNGFYINDHYKDKPQIAEALSKIQSIISKGNRTVSVDGDYGNIPEFYTQLSIGRWNKEFVVREV